MLLEKNSIRSVQASFHTSQRALSRLRNYLLENKVTVDDWNKLSDAERRQLFYRSPESKEKRNETNIVEIDEFEMIYQKLKSRGSHYSIKAGWREYRKKHPTGMGSSQFYVHYRKWEQKEHPGRLATAPVNRQPGKYLYIDWVGDQIPLVRDPDHPERRLKAHFLVFTMGYSSYSFATAFPDEKTPSVINGINQALSYMGRLPQAFRPDNMKTAVTSNTKEGLVLSTAMEDLQNYYDVPVLPARPLKPRDKASCERLVLILETELLPRLDGRLFESFEDLNRTVANFMNDHNTRIKTGESLSRKELFEKYDKPNMKPLPLRPFSLYEYKQLKVQRNCHIKYNGVYYSVPYQYVQQRVIVKISGTALQICDRYNKPLCSHAIPHPKSGRLYVTAEEHLKSSYQKARQIEQRGIHHFYDRASRIGPSLRKLIEQVARSYPYEEQSFSSCEGIIQSCKGHPDWMSDKAAENCLTNGQIGYKAFRTELDFLAKQNPHPISSGVVEQKDGIRKAHLNIRGKDYYK